MHGAAKVGVDRQNVRMPVLLVTLLASMAGELTWASHNVRGSGECVRPGICTPPNARYSRVLPVTPRQQWNSAGGFCGSMSIQTAHLAFGAWISQGLVRRANEGVHGAGHCDGGTPGHPGHDKGEGCEVGALNLGATVANLKLEYDEWDYNSSKPQSPRYKAWMKNHLAHGHAVVWLVMCKGDAPCPYPGACPNGGAFGHVEPVWGLYSNHSLDDPTVYPDDVIVHSSDQDLNPYYRSFHTLQDTSAMQGNCRIAQAGFGRNEMYPCINDMTDYGVAIAGIKGSGDIPVHLAVNAKEEPNTRRGEPPARMRGTVTAGPGLVPGKEYELCRFEGTNTLPTHASQGCVGARSRVPFIAHNETWEHTPLLPILSDTATYFRVFARTLADQLALP